MTIQQLQYVVALDNHRHFVKAAESCFVAQPTLTLQVKKLETEIGVAIFDRSSQPIVPTSMGERFIVKARYILKEVESLKELVNQDRNELEGTYKIGVIPTLAPYLLPLFLKAFTEDFPKVYLEIREMQSEEIIKSLLHDKLDIGIMATPLEENYLREIVLFYEPFSIYAHQDHPISKKKELSGDAIREKGLWLLDKGHCFRNQVINLCDKDEQLTATKRISFESGAIETLKNMIQRFSGYTLIPELAINPQTDTPFIRPLPSPQPAREISLVVHRNFTKELLLNSLRKVINEAVPEHFKKNQRFYTVNWR